MDKFIYIGVFLSSIVGLQVFGVSFNKIGLIPLEIFLLYGRMKENGYRLVFKINRHSSNLVLWYIFSIASAITGIIFSIQMIDKFSNEIAVEGIKQIIENLFIYMPILLMLPSHWKGIKVSEIIKNAIIITAKIQAIWALLQTVLFYLGSFDLNKWLFADIFRSQYEWTRYNNIGGVILLRPTGLNYDAAFLGLLMVLGFLFERSKIWKTLFVSVIVVSFSRSALVTVALLILYQILIKIKRKEITISPSKVIKAGLFTIFLFLVFLIIYNNFEFVRIQIHRMIERMFAITTGADGTVRHSNYPIVALDVMLFHMPLYTKFFGIGLQCSGVAFNVYSNYIHQFTLTQNFLNNVWAIESDFATVLLGSGIVGFILYYGILIKCLLYNKDSVLKELSFCLMIFGTMYNMCGLTIMQFILWIIVYSYDTRKKEE